eukprot:293770-Lingulodinium_polyedra.AAC.1
MFPIVCTPFTAMVSGTTVRRSRCGRITVVRRRCFLPYAGSTLFRNARHGGMKSLPSVRGVV